MMTRGYLVAGCFVLAAWGCAADRTVQPVAKPTTAAKSRPPVAPVAKVEHGELLDVGKGLAEAVVRKSEDICTKNCEFEYTALSLRCSDGVCAVRFRAQYPNHDPESIEVEVPWKQGQELYSVAHFPQFFEALAYGIRQWQAKTVGVPLREKGPPPAFVAKPGYALGQHFSELVVGDLNELCGDTFCEGEFDWKFRTLSCGDADCTLSFVATRDGKSYDTTLSFAWQGPVVEHLGADDDIRDAFHSKLLVELEKWEKKRYTEMGVNYY